MFKLQDEAKITRFFNIVSGKEVSKTPSVCAATLLMTRLINNMSKPRNSRARTVTLMNWMVDAANKFMFDIETKQLITNPKATSSLRLKLGEVDSQKANALFSGIDRVKHA